MAKKKQYAPILEPACPPTHFTVEQAKRAVLKVLEEDRIAAAARRRERAAGRQRTRRTYQATDL